MPEASYVYRKGGRNIYTTMEWSHIAGRIYIKIYGASLAQRKPKPLLQKAGSE